MAPPIAHKSLWDLDSTSLDGWARSLETIFGPEKTESKGGGGVSTNQGSVKAAKVSPELAGKAWSNLQTAITQLQTQVEVGAEAAAAANGDDDGDEKRMNGNPQPPTKRRKKELLSVVDPFNIYKHTIRVPQDDEEDPKTVEDEAARDIKDTQGGKLTQLSISGLVNGFAGQLGGVVRNKRLETIEGVKTFAIATCDGASLAQLKYLANVFYQSIQTRIEADSLTTTPIRIQQMLAPDMTPGQLASIRSRIYETVVLGKGVSQVEEEDVPTAGTNHQNAHAAEKFKRCPNCGNNDQSLFVMDRKNGDVICENCGTVVEESLMHEGSQYRKFEGEIDRNHHGDSANPLYSNAHNMSTTLGGLQITTGAGVGGFGSQNKKGLETVLRNAHAYTELNISQFGKGDRRTRIGYKDKQKRDAFYNMSHVGDALHLHEAVVQRAKELFAGFRDDRELVVDFKGVLAACLCEAFDQLSKDGRRMLQQREEAPAETFNNPRANRRNELHHANLAGRGGLMLDKEGLAQAKLDDPSDKMAAIIRKPVSSWSVEDCRSWMMEASKMIALLWVDERKKGAKKVPEGSQEELEGQMIEHAFTLCDKLEKELEEYNEKNAGNAANGRGRVNTPRVNDMAKLGIKWQHSHERGSGGKGGVGGSGHTQPRRSGRTAGQILILKSAKKLGEMVDDMAAGEAIHKELRTLVGKQETLKRKKLLEEQSKQRHQQMQRKPWLQARAQID